MNKERKNVLIVDDEEVIRNICTRSLETRGYDITTVENGLKALECLRSKTIDLVFSDIKMPMMDGMELLETIKRDFPYVSVVIMTAFATIESAIQAMKNGAYDFILKPVKPDQIRIVASKCFYSMQLNEENQALRIANQKLRELQTMKNKFIAITSHELRTPVSHLKGFLSILSDETFRRQLSGKEEEQCRTVINDALADLESIVAGMHNLIHLENGNATLRHEDIDINNSLEQCVKSSRIIAKKRRHTIEYNNLAETDLWILADRHQLKGVFNELLQNAIKFTRDNGKIEVTLKQEGDYAVVSIKDNGIGIAKAEQGNIFEKFYEVQDTNYHSSSKEGFLGGGLGLGLPSVRAIVEAHGGGVKVRSEPKQGSEFLVYLPLNNKEEHAEPTEETKPA